MPPMQPVTSSQIAAIGHDPVSHVLKVQFTNGAIYEYQNVEPETHQQIMTAESVGKAFNSTVKSNPTKYPYQKV